MTALTREGAGGRVSGHVNRCLPHAVQSLDPLVLLQLERRSSCADCVGLRRGAGEE